MKVTITITRDEWWPVYSIDTNPNEKYDRTLDLPEETVKRIQDAFEAFSEAETECRKLYELLYGEQK